MSAGTKDKNFDLISTVYHALQGCSACDTYINDAEQAGDEELANYFKGVKKQYHELAELGQSMLIGRLS
jgi:hypothetical protein